jgi:hypothetical protein
LRKGIKGNAVVAGRFDALVDRGFVADADKSILSIYRRFVSEKKADESMFLSIEGLSEKGRQTSRYLLIEGSSQMPTSRYLSIHRRFVSEKKGRRVDMLVDRGFVSGRKADESIFVDQRFVFADADESIYSSIHRRFVSEKKGRRVDMLVDRGFVSGRKADESIFVDRRFVFADADESIYLSERQDISQGLGGKPHLLFKQ